MSIILGLFVLVLLIGFVCYSNRCTVNPGRSLPTEISKQ